MMALNRETHVRVRGKGRDAQVEYSLIPEAARAVAQVLFDAATRSKPYDSGFGEDAAALSKAADEADRLGDWPWTS